MLNDYLKQTLSSIKVGETGCIYIIDSKGNLINRLNDDDEVNSKQNLFQICLTN